MILELIMNGSSSSLAETIVVIVLTLIVALLTITLREYVRDRFTVKLGGSANPTLNPLKHINTHGIFSVVVLALFSASWIKAKNPGLSKGKNVIVALSAPLTNFIVAFVSVFLYDILRVINVNIYIQNENAPTALIWISMFFSTCVLVNLAYGLFDLIPVPGTNGGIILAQLFSEKTGEKFLSYEKYSYIILLFIAAVSARSGFTASALNAVATVMETPFVALSNLLFPAQINY